MKVSFIPISAIDPNDEYADEHIDHYVRFGELTTDHPSSSYGIPVVVAEDGTPHGPGDTYGGHWSGMVGAIRDHALEAAAAAGGWDRQPNQGETTSTY